MTEARESLAGRLRTKFEGTTGPGMPWEAIAAEAHAYLKERLTREELAQTIGACDGTLLGEDQATVYHKMADAILALIKRKVAG